MMNRVLQFVVYVSCMAGALAATPATPLSAAVSSTLAPKTEGTGTLGTALTEMRISFQVGADTAAKGFKITVDKDDITLPAAANYMLGYTAAGACPTDLKGATITEQTTGAAGGFDGAPGTITFSPDATTGTITVSLGADINIKASQCMVVIIAKAKLNNCKATNAVSVTTANNQDGTTSPSAAKTGDYIDGTCKACTDVKTTAVTTPTEIAAASYCYCGENTSTDTSRTLCGHATKKQKCVVTLKTTGQFSTGDTYACSDFAAKSGAAGVYFATLSMFLVMLCKRLL